MVQYQLPMGIRDAAHRRGREKISKSIGNTESTLAGIRMFFTKMEAYTGMAERLVRYLAIEAALQTEI